MRYKQIVSKKLDELDNVILGLKSLLSGSPSREQVENQFTKSKDKIEEIQTLINAEHDE